MSMQTWVETLVTAQGDGNALNTSTTATSLLTGSAASAKYTFPANYFAIGKAFRVTARGRLSNIVTTPGTITLDCRCGSNVIFNGGAVSMNATAKTNVSWEFEAILTCRAIGSGSGTTFLGIGTLTSESVVGAGAGTALTASLPASAPAVGTGIDATAAQTLDFFATFSISNAANSIQLHEYILESLN